MTLQYNLPKQRKILVASWFDISIIILVLFLGGFYLHDLNYWSVGNIGGAPYGDAQFWWSGAVNVAEGIFQDNPGKGFRPGYFVLSGLTLPVLGLQFEQFYPYFLLTFLTITCLFFLALRSVLGKFTSACMVCMIIFNPFTAEWIATSTTDATGLILNIAALTCLINGINKGLSKRWLILFSILFALGNLTRPLMTPFIGFVILSLFLVPNISLKSKLNISTSVLVAFFLPLLLWMTAQKLIINEWSISSNDASAFYAASDPNIQVWNGTMYDHITDLAKKKYNTTQPSSLQINRTFWIETAHNYIKYYHYHLNRIIPHIIQLANFSPKIATHGTGLYRAIFLALIAFGLSIWLFFQKRWLRALTILLLGVYIYQTPSIIGSITLAGAMIGLWIKRGETNKLAIFLLSSYWLTGIVALYFVGGTWGPPLGAAFDLNALGYRLGAQVFFAGDLLAAYFIVWIAYLSPIRKHIPRRAHIPNNFIYQSWQTFLTQTSPLANRIILGYLGIFCIAVALIYTIGSSIVIQRTYARSHSHVRPYPELSPVINLYQQHNKSTPLIAKNHLGALDAQIIANMENKIKIPDILVTGTTSAFIWRMENQQRTQLMIHPQTQSYPITMGPRFLIVDVPQYILPKDWGNKQGAFIIKQIPDDHNTSNQPYYLTTPSIRAFFPLAPDGKSFDLSKAAWFPLVINATQLETIGSLQFKNANITWGQDSGKEKFKRRFFITPKKNDNILISLDVTNAKGPRTLSFSYALGDIPGSNSVRQGYYDVQVSLNEKSSSHAKLILSNREAVPTTEKGELPLQKIKFTIPDNSKYVEINFKHILPGTGIWIYEFNLLTNDFVLQATKNNSKHKG